MSPKKSLLIVLVLCLTFAAGCGGGGKKRVRPGGSSGGSSSQSQFQTPVPEYREDNSGSIDYGEGSSSNIGELNTSLPDLSDIPLDSDPIVAPIELPTVDITKPEKLFTPLEIAATQEASR